MMKFLTIILLMFYIIRLFTRLKGMKKLMINADKIINRDDNVDYSKEQIWTIMKFLIPAFTIFVLQVVEFFYIFFATSYGNTYVTIGFIVFWFILLGESFLMDNKKIKERSNDEECNAILKFRFSLSLINLIGVAYFGYMFFVLFIN